MFLHLVSTEAGAMIYLGTAVIITIIAFTCHKLQQWCLRKHFAAQHNCKPPNQRSMGDPIFGVRGIIEEFKIRKANQMLQASTGWYETHGPTFMKSVILGETNIRTIDEKNIQAVFSTKSADMLVGISRLAAMGPFMGEGILTQDGPKWERSQALLKPSFHNKNISDLTATNTAVTHLISHIPSDGLTVDMQPLLLHMFTDTATLFLMGRSTSILDKNAKYDGPIDGLAFRKAFQSSLVGCGLRFIAGRMMFLVPKSMTTKHWKVVWRYIDDQTTQILGSEKSDVGDKHSLLSSVAQQTNDKTEIRNQIIHGLTAAQDTTATMVSNTLFLLARHPEIWNRVRAEVQDIDPKTLTFEETKSLRFVRNVFKESLRLHPIFTTLGRTACTNTILPRGGGPNGESPVYVAPGTGVQCDFHVLHRRKDIYGDDAQDFNPDRWDHINPRPWQYMAFGGGPRACLGQYKALSEACCVLVGLAQEFGRLESRDEKEWVRAPGFIASNANGCQVAFHRV